MQNYNHRLLTGFLEASCTGLNNWEKSYGSAKLLSCAVWHTSVPAVGGGGVRQAHLMAKSRMHLLLLALLRHRQSDKRGPAGAVIEGKAKRYKLEDGPETTQQYTAAQVGWLECSSRKTGCWAGEAAVGKTTPVAAAVLCKARMQLPCMCVQASTVMPDAAGPGKLCLDMGLLET